LKEKVLGHEVIEYPERKNTGYVIRDAVYNWVLERYRKNNHPWTKQDEFFFNGFIYQVTTYIGYIIFVTLFWWILSIIEHRYGPERAIIAAILL